MTEFNEMVETVIDWFNEASPEGQEQFLSSSKKSLIMYHHSVGRDIRNQFRLWESTWDPQLDDQGIDNSPDHPDAISMAVIEAVWERLREDT